MSRLFTFILLLFSSILNAQQNPLAQTRWGAYMGGPGGGYLAMDYYFSDDTVYGILTSVPMPPTKMFVYTVNGNTATFKNSPNTSYCNGDIDTFSFTIVADTLDFVEQSATCPELTATWNPYYFIRTSLSAVKDISGPSAFSIYPNPARHTLYINSNQTGSDAYALRIYSITGVLVKNETLVNSQQAISLVGISLGIYVAEIQSGSQSYKQKISIE